MVSANEKKKKISKQGLWGLQRAEERGKKHSQRLSPLKNQHANLLRASEWRAELDRSHAPTRARARPFLPPFAGGGQRRRRGHRPQQNLGTEVSVTWIKKLRRERSRPKARVAKGKTRSDFLWGTADNLHTLRTRQQHVAEEFADKLTTLLLTLVPKQKKDANLYLYFFFQVRASSVHLILEAGS